MDIAFEATTQDDAEVLVLMRIASMQESLERIGRFDPQRARVRFLATFEPALCSFIVSDGQRAGFLQIRRKADHLFLEHLYVMPEHQGKGLGSAALCSVLDNAAQEGLPIRLGALRGSDSNRFYQRHGFVRVDESEWDINYIREAVRWPKP